MTIASLEDNKHRQDKDLTISSLRRSVRFLYSSYHRGTYLNKQTDGMLFFPNAVPAFPDPPPFR